MQRSKAIPKVIGRLRVPKLRRSSRWIDLSDGWTAWLKENDRGKGSGATEVISPAGGSPQECVTELWLGEDGHRNALCVLTLITGLLANDVN